MKKIVFLLLSLSFFTTVYGQKTLPEVKVGTVMNASAFVNGQQYPLILTVKSTTAPVILTWSVEGYGDGTFEMTAKAIESATKIYTGQTALGATKLSDDETFGILSKAAFKALADTKSFTYNGAKFKVQTPDSKPLKLEGKEADAIHVISEDSKIELWVLNNPALPLLMQTSGLPTDITVNSIK